MKCPYCGNKCADDARYCDVCKQPLPVAEPSEENMEAGKAPKTLWQKIFIAICWIACFIVIGIGIYKLVFWIESYQITRLYTRGAFTPTLNEIELADGRDGHALIFYGEDGDNIFLPEMDRCLSVCGGVARLDIADSEWFGDEVNEYDYADVRFAPILIKENGKEIQLPVIEYSIDVPESPLTVSSPEKDGINVVTSSYPLALQVVPGSSVYVNGEDLTDRVDRSGALSAQVSVQPIGDNTYTIIVRTPQHKETRRDVVLYRQKYDINIELDSEISNSTSEISMTISGVCEPGASITVDTPYMPESMMLDPATGRFQFIAQMEKLGDNIVRFRATKPGRADAIVSFTVDYKPSLALYSSKAWRMDYDQLTTLFEQWTGQVFLCEGTIVDIFTNDEGMHCMVMDVGTGGEQQLIVLENETTITPTLGAKYTAYADVDGRYIYNNVYYPMLVARYMDLYEN